MHVLQYMSDENSIEIISHFSIILSASILFELRIHSKHRTIKMEINKMDIKNNIELENLAQQLHRPVMSLKDFSLVSQQDLA